MLLVLQSSTTSSPTQAAYEKGVLDGTAKIHSQLAAVANQVYSNVQEQLDAIEKEEKDNAKEKVMKWNWSCLQ